MNKKDLIESNLRHLITYNDEPRTDSVTKKPSG